MSRFFRLLRRAAVSLLAAIGALFLFATFTPIDKWWAAALAGTWHDPAGDILIVLGGSNLDYGTIGGSTYWRGVYTVLCYKQCRYGRIVATGGPPGENSSALALRRFLVSQGIPSSVIQVESDSNSTRENALFTAKLLKNTPGRKLLLTSDFHMYRASRAFRKAGLEVFTVPFPDVGKRELQWLARWPAFLDLLDETAKIAYYRARGWI
jgi:uncharacterized SAM-binding protein YcdF (DUF218 family)